MFCKQNLPEDGLGDTEAIKLRRIRVSPEKSELPNWETRERAHVAMHEIKMLLVRLLIEYEFKYPPGKSRPKTSYAEENVFIDTELSS